MNIKLILITTTALVLFYSCQNDSLVYCKSDKECHTNEQCQNGICNIPFKELECQSGETLCLNICINTMSNNTHCGDCFKSCLDGKKCVRGNCQEFCPTGLQQCENDSCTDVSSNKDHCGKCGSKCPPNTVCESGRCKCPDTSLFCSGVCMDVASDTEHCGSCLTKCLPGESCIDGKCICPEKSKICDGKCVGINYSWHDCGDCGVQCSNDELCFDGKCKVPVKD